MDLLLFRVVFSFISLGIPGVFLDTQNLRDSKYTTGTAENLEKLY